MVGEKKRRSYVREADRFDDFCEACERLQDFKPGKSCFDCDEAERWAEHQHKVPLTVDEYELNEPENHRYCSNKSCVTPGGPVRLKPGQFYFCTQCHPLKSGDHPGIFDELHWVQGRVGPVSTK